MKTLQEYILESINEAKIVVPYTSEELKEIAKNYSDEESKLMVGIEDDEAHAYLKPKNFNGKFFSELIPKDAQIMFLKTVIKSLAKSCPELILLVKTWEAIDTSSRINNLSREYYSVILTANGMLFNSMKEAKDYIKEHKFIKYVENAKRVKCTPMTCKDILNFINEKEKSIEFGAKSAGFRLVQI